MEFYDYLFAFIFTFINIICSPRRTEREGTHHEITGPLVILPFLFGFVVCRQIIIYCVDGEDTLWRVLWGKTGQTDDPLYLRVPARGRIICINCSFLNERVCHRGESAIGGDERSFVYTCTEAAADAVLGSM